jgi:dihydrofolate reductase
MSIFSIVLCRQSGWKCGIMCNMNLIIIAAFTENYVIGRQGQLPWHLPADLKRFKQLTQNKTILMGRKTHESIGKVLLNRENIILSRTQRKGLQGCQYYSSLSLILNRYQHTELMVIGGQSIFETTLPLANKMYLTLIHDTLPGDKYFPRWDAHEWHETAREEFRSRMSYSFVTLERCA